MREKLRQQQHLDEACPLMVGVPIVLTTGERGPARPYSMAYAQRRVREARTAAGLPSHITLDACRHGGMTELGDAELTEQGVMSLIDAQNTASRTPLREAHRAPRACSTIEAWPRLLRPEQAAAYVGEKSVESFRRAI